MEVEVASVPPFIGWFCSLKNSFMDDKTLFAWLFCGFMEDWKQFNSRSLQSNLLTTEFAMHFELWKEEKSAHKIALEAS